MDCDFEFIRRARPPISVLQRKLDHLATRMRGLRNRKLHSPDFDHCAWLHAGDVEFFCSEEIDFHEGVLERSTGPVGEGQFEPGKLAAPE